MVEKPLAFIPAIMALVVFGMPQFVSVPFPRLVFLPAQPFFSFPPAVASRVFPRFQPNFMESTIWAAVCAAGEMTGIITVAGFESAELAQEENKK